MPVFRLEPLSGGEPEWEASDLPPGPIWVNADDEVHARVLAQAVSSRMSNLRPSEKLLLNPWRHKHIVKCERDPSKSVPEGRVLLENGELRKVGPN